MATGTDKYIHNEVVHNLTSPVIIVPFIVELLQPASVADIGCGTGTFLKVFKDHGIKRVLGVDGSWVKKEQLHISFNEFIQADLEKPININQEFDLVLCLEVAEHLSSKSAETIIESLISLGKTIVFSAAVTLQGGQNHINEQPVSYWQNIFKKHQYYFYDVFRNEFWNNQNVDWWYKQNMFLVLHESVVPPVSIAQKKVAENVLLHIHPDLLGLHIKQKQNALDKAQYFKNKIARIKSGEEIWKLYGSMLFKKIKKSF